MKPALDLHTFQRCAIRPRHTTRALVCHRGFSQGATKDRKRDRDPKRFENVFLPLLKEYKIREGHLDVPISYRITAADCARANVDESNVGYALGTALRVIQSQGRFLMGPPHVVERRVESLQALGFELSDNRSWQHLVYALTWFRDRSNHPPVTRERMLVPRSLTMSAEELEQAGLPANLAPFKLGRHYANVKSRGTYVRNSPGERLRALRALGCEWATDSILAQWMKFDKSGRRASGTKSAPKSVAQAAHQHDR